MSQRQSRGTITADKVDCGVKSRAGCRTSRLDGQGQISVGPAYPGPATSRRPCRPDDRRLPGLGAASQDSRANDRGHRYL